MLSETSSVDGLASVGMWVMTGALSLCIVFMSFDMSMSPTLVFLITSVPLLTPFGPFSMALTRLIGFQSAGTKKAVLLYSVASGVGVVSSGCLVCACGVVAGA